MSACSPTGSVGGAGVALGLGVGLGDAEDVTLAVGVGEATVGEGVDVGECEPVGDGVSAGGVTPVGVGEAVRSRDGPSQPTPKSSAANAAAARPL
jgi:hypothetical protein